MHQRKVPIINIDIDIDIEHTVYLSTSRSVVFLSTTMDHEPKSAGKATYMASEELGASHPGRAERAEMKGATCTL